MKDIFGVALMLLGLALAVSAPVGDLAIWGMAWFGGLTAGCGIGVAVWWR